MNKGTLAIMQTPNGKEFELSRYDGKNADDQSDRWVRLKHCRDFGYLVDCIPIVNKGERILIIREKIDET